MGGPPLQRGVRCGAVACQVKGDTVHNRKELPKIFWKFKKAWSGIGALDYVPRGGVGRRGPTTETRCLGLQLHAADAPWITCPEAVSGPVQIPLHCTRQTDKAFHRIDDGS